MKKLLLLFFFSMSSLSSFSQYEIGLYSYNMNPYVRNENYDAFLVSTTIDSTQWNGDNYYTGNIMTMGKEYLRINISQVKTLQDSLASKLNRNEVYSWAKQASRPEYNKSDIGLANVNNTSDLDKPISTATQIALNGKLSSEVDGSITNELQTISKFGDNLSISGGNTIALGIPQAVNLTAGNRITITGTYPNLTISYIEPTATTVTRPLNTNYTISSTRQANVFYSITSTATNPLLAGTSSGNAYLEYSTNAGSIWIGVSQAGNSNGVGLAVAVALTNGQTSVLSGTIPANALVRIRTVVIGSATVAYTSGQEIY